MLLTNDNSQIITNKSQLTEFFISGCKTEEKTGVETEKLLVYKNSYKALIYEDIVKILECFDENQWKRIYSENHLLGLENETGTISLEPGSQIELSLKPYKTLNEITTKLTEFYLTLDNYADKFGAIVLNCGSQIVSTYDDINIIPKKRYEYMTKYLPKQGLTPFIMMRETAGIQANFDYKSEKDAIKKLSLALKMSPFISSIYANSPIRQSKLNGYKSFRANSWLNVDEQRCGYIDKHLFDKKTQFSFTDYVEILLDIPMIFINRNDRYYAAPITFREFMNKGYKGLIAQKSDWQTHLSLFFPDVRLKNYIEIRNHDAQNSIMTFSVPAFWKGIMYNNEAMEEIKKILEKYEFEDFLNLRKETPILGINTKLGNLKIIDLIKEFFDISYASLKMNNQQEEKYLDCVYEYISLKKVPADDFIKKFRI